MFKLLTAVLLVVYVLKIDVCIQSFIQSLQLYICGVEAEW